MSDAASSMTLRFLGAGGAFSRRYGTTCSVVTLAAGQRWLIDCGRQAPDQLRRAGLHWHDIEGQFVTHVHGDHIFGLEDFAFLRFFEGRPGCEAVMRGGPRPKLIVHSAVREELWECLGPSLRYLKRGGDPRAGTLEDFFEVLAPRETEGPRDNPWPHAECFATPGVEIVTRESQHVPGKPSCSLELRVRPDDPGDPRIAWWSGDRTVDAQCLAALEPTTTVFFHDCTFVEYEGQVHGAFSQLAQLPEAVRRKTVLMHHEDDVEEHRAQAEELGFRIALPGDLYDLESGQHLATGEG